LLHGDLDGAAAAYREVDSLARTPGEQAMARAAWAVLGVFVLLMVGSARRGAGSMGAAWRGLARPPTEALYLLPVAALLAAAAQTEHVLLGHAVTIVALGGVGVAWLNGATLALQPPPLGRGRALLHLVLCVAAIVALGVIAVLREQLVDLLAETWRHGPEG
jgi:hypothetical protein